MADYISLAKPLQLSTPGKAPIAGLTVADTAALEAIDSPWLGMVVYVEADGKTYRITELKDVSLGVFTKKAVSKYEPVPDKTDLEGKAAANHQHTLSDLSDLSDLDDEYAAKNHNHAGSYAAANHQHTLSDLSDLSELENQFAAKEHDHAGSYAPLQEGKVPADYLPENSGAKPATITLPVPFDEDGDNVSLYVDIGTDPQFAEETYTRIRMTDHYAKMRVFYNEMFHTLTEGHLGLPEYGATVSFTLDTEMFPGYIPGTTYYARYTWMDSKGAFDGWKGFMFSGDVADMAPIRMEYESPPSVKAETAASGTLSLDYLDGEIQNYRMSSDLSIDLDDVANVPFGEALICNIRLIGGTLTVSNGNSSQTYTENKTYMVVITNFGTPQVAVTETI